MKPSEFQDFDKDIHPYERSCHVYLCNFCTQKSTWHTVGWSFNVDWINKDALEGTPIPSLLPSFLQVLVLVKLFMEE